MPDDVVARTQLAKLLKQVADGALTAREALAVISREVSVPKDDRLFSDGYEWLYHFDSDEDIRARDSSYASYQIEALRRVASRLEAVGMPAASRDDTEPS
jgi:hypothetical protein